MAEKFGNRLQMVANSGTATNNVDHGIIVSRIIGGNEKNGVAKNVSLVVADATVSGSGGSAYVETKLSMLEALRDNGAVIYNNSLGTVGYDVLDFSTKNKNSSWYFVNQIGEDILKFYKDEVNDGKLFVWAAGNTSGDVNPTLEAGLPYHDKDLQKGWINVVGLKTPNTDANLDWSGLKPLSPAGVAKNWTVTAIGEYAFPINSHMDDVVTGSSFAAATVSGTAALIKEKYPWMTGDLIRQTILSTATDIGAPGVDRMFGWGLLNTDKALKGPALFSQTLALGPNVELNVPFGVYVFENDISGDAGVIKNGGGEIVLAGNSTFTGATIVNDGKLKIGGQYVSGIQVNNGTLETGQNAVISNNVVAGNGATVVNNATNSIIQGTLILDRAKLVSDVNSNLKVDGKVELNNAELEITSKDENGEAKYVTAKGIENSVILATHGISGDLSGIKSESLLNALAENNGTEITAKLSRKNVEEYVKSIDTNSFDEIWKNVSENLETSFAKLDEEIENGNIEKVTEFSKEAAKIQTLSLNTASAILDSLSGQIYASAQALTFQQSQTINKDLTNRLTMLGLLENTGEKAGLWMSGIGANGKLREDGYGTGKTKIVGGQIGIDKTFGDNLILGTAFSYSTADVKFDRYGGESTAQNLGISLYGRLENERLPFYLQGRAGIGFVNSDVERDIILSAISSSRAKIEHKDRVYSGYLETGYDIKKGNFAFTPFVGISHDYVQRGAFTEENSQFGLTAEKARYSQTTGLVGARFTQGFNWGQSSKTTLQGYVTYQNAFNNEDLSFEAAYTGLSNAKFKVKGIGLKKDRTWVGLGILNEINPTFAWYTNYDAKFEDGKLNNNVFTTGMRLNFD